MSFLSSSSAESLRGMLMTFHGWQAAPGNSPNVVRAMEYANSIGCRTIALTGRDGGQLGPKAQLNIQIPVNHMGRIEDAHMNVCHMIGYYFMDVESK